MIIPLMLIGAAAAIDITSSILAHSKASKGGFKLELKKLS